MADGDQGAGAGGAAAEGDAGGGSAADVLLGGDAGTGGAAGAGGDGGGAAAGADGGAAGGDGAADAAFLAQFSTDPLDGDGPSLQDWVKSVGVKDVAGLAKIARDNQKAVRDGGRIKVPGEGASADEIKAYHAAIGVPETVQGYALDPINDAEGNAVPLQTELLDRLAAKALDGGMPAAAYKAVVGEFVQAQLEQLAGLEAERKAEAGAWMKEQGDKAPAQSAAVNRGAEVLGLDGTEVAKLRNELGSRRTLDVLAKLGNAVSEDMVAGIGGSTQKFLMNGAQAQAEIDRMRGDPATVSKMTIKGSPENAKYERLLKVAGEAANRQAAAGL